VQFVLCGNPTATPTTPPATSRDSSHGNARGGAVVFGLQPVFEYASGLTCQLAKTGGKVPGVRRLGAPRGASQCLDPSPSLRGHDLSGA
jgi:hypothetical protein